MRIFLSDAVDSVLADAWHFIVLSYFDLSLLLFLFFSVGQSSHHEDTGILVHGDV